MKNFFSRLRRSLSLIDATLLSWAAIELFVGSETTIIQDVVIAVACFVLATGCAMIDLYRAEA